MKPTNQFSMLIVIVLLSISSISYAQDQHVIILEVNTAEIKKPDVNVYCRFEGQGPDVAVEDYTIHVKNGDVIRWQGVSTSSENDVVSITSINYHGGKNLLGVNILQGNEGIVIGTVQNGAVGDEEKYTVSFKVLNNGIQRNGTFLIDPKIKVR
jgi:hypothetical protein